MFAGREKEPVPDARSDISANDSLMHILTLTKGNYRLTKPIIVGFRSQTRQPQNSSMQRALSIAILRLLFGSLFSG